MHTLLWILVIFFIFAIGLTYGFDVALYSLLILILGPIFLYIFLYCIFNYGLNFLMHNPSVMAILVVFAPFIMAGSAWMYVNKKVD